MFQKHLNDWDTYLYLLTSSYNMQRHRETKTSTCNVILPKETPWTATFGKLIRPASDMPGEVSLRHMTHWPLQRIELLKTTVFRRLFLIENSYSRNFDKIEWQELTFELRDYIFVNCTTQAPNAAHAANEWQIVGSIGCYQECLDCTVYSALKSIL